MSALNDSRGAKPPPPARRLAGAPAAAHSQAVSGIVCAAVAAICFASKGVFAKLLYADGWNFETVLTVRALSALPLIWLIAWARRVPHPLTPSLRVAVAGAAGAGLLCYYVGAQADFAALMVLDASVERALIFSYPSMVVILHALLYRKPPTGAAVLALALTYAGILLVVAGFDVTVLRANLKGAILVLGCALTFAIYYLASDRWTPPLGSVLFTAASLTASTIALSLQMLLHHGLPRGLGLTARDGALMGGLVLIATVLPMFLMTEGVRRLGAQRAAVVSSVGPPATIALGSLVLAEHFNLPQWIGVALIVAGILVLELKRPDAPAPAPD